MKYLFIASLAFIYVLFYARRECNFCQQYFQIRRKNIFTSIFFKQNFLNTVPIKLSSANIMFLDLVQASDSCSALT